MSSCQIDKQAKQHNNKNIYIHSYICIQSFYQIKMQVVLGKIMLLSGRDRR
jgi:hypothetical protein